MTKTFELYQTHMLHLYWRHNQCNTELFPQWISNVIKSFYEYWFCCRKNMKSFFNFHISRTVILEPFGSFIIIGQQLYVTLAPKYLGIKRLNLTIWYWKNCSEKTRFFFKLIDRFTKKMWNNVVNKNAKFSFLILLHSWNVKNYFNPDSSGVDFARKVGD